MTQYRIQQRDWGFNARYRVQRKFLGLWFTIPNTYSIYLDEAKENVKRLQRSDPGKRIKHKYKWQELS